MEVNMQNNIQVKTMVRSAIAVGVLSVMSSMSVYAAEEAQVAGSAVESAAPAESEQPVVPVPKSAVDKPVTPPPPTTSMAPTEATASSALQQKATDATAAKNLDETFTKTERQYSLSKKGSYSAVYDFGYSYYANTALDLALDSSSSTLTRLRIENNAQHALTNSFTFQYGLLNNLTMTATLPFVSKINPPTATSTTGLGDLGFGARWEPFPIGATPLPVTLFGSMNLSTGDSPYDINPLTDLSTGSGYYSLGGGVSTRKYIDPIVLFATLSGNYGFEVTGLNQANGSRVLNSFTPGYTTGIGFGFAYSLNYDVSITMSYQQSFNFGSEFRFTNGDISTPANASSATLNSSLGIRVSPKTIVNVSMGFGLTPDSPNVLLGLSFPLDFLGLSHEVK